MHVPPTHMFCHIYVVSIHIDMYSVGANILRDCDGNVKLADFGTSKQLQVRI